VLFYNALRHGMDYVDPGASYYETRYRERVVKIYIGVPRPSDSFFKQQRCRPPSRPFLRKVAALLGPQRRATAVLMDAVAALAPGSGLIAVACKRWGCRAPAFIASGLPETAACNCAPRPTPMRALVAKERQVVLDLLREPRFVDLAPAEVYAACSTRASICARSAPCIAFSRA